MDPEERIKQLLGPEVNTVIDWVKMGKVAANVEKKLLWTQVVGRKNWPTNMQELAKANKKPVVQTRPKKDNRVLLRFAGGVPDPAVTELNLRAALDKDFKRCRVS
ncbi:hypothetical protein AOQ84DRAFT_376693 [Glonium stellatum]|uniref:Uncharacterized protein n=1 Tax=Glonium stellatum TaxID=574774 RepID=A0A8E2F132_9PEZI|nr:hypothetical protein AOQ84DRAFT_376693 [Glonium stellatum]